MRLINFVLSVHHTSALKQFPLRLFVNYTRYSLFSNLCWLWNIYEGAELPKCTFYIQHKILYTADGI